MRSSWSSSNRALSPSPHGAAFAFAVCLVSTACNGEPSGADGVSVDVSGVWDADFSGTIEGSGTSQTDSFVMDMVQSGSDVAGSVRSGGNELALELSGTVAGATLDYEARGSVEPDCEVFVEARVTVSSAGTEFSGPQTQSTCEGTAVGTVRGRRR